ncbi:MAG: outer membrane beta-barrel domain-containing protein [Alphaproteobacteria bacterium]|nr:outer membrane beta-barrel domain-containing protein [Alphaproteobacteria bacterium]MCB9697892.1 outer membrane beta-barrel domain-containing protein [Alphaproteobacteria bacterium]
MLLSLLLTTARAAEPVDIGIIRDEDITVVQKLLYPKTGRSEIGLAAGWMPFDAYLTTPNGQLSYTQHTSEVLAIGLVAGGGYGFKTKAYQQMEGPAIGVAPYAYRYLGSVLAGVEWSPIYAKLNWNGGRVMHFDVYAAGRGGVTLEQSVIPSGGTGIGPTVSPGVGGRFFLGDNTALKVELRDDLLFEFRKLTDSWEFKQNANVTLGLAFLSKAKKESR